MAEPNRDFTQEKETTQADLPRRGTSARGFASMDPEKQREIARKGGRAAHLKGTAHEFTPEEARLAGRKGGEAVSRDRNHMAEIGREGGQARGARARQAAATNVHPINRGRNPNADLGIENRKESVSEWGKPQYWTNG